MPPNFFGWVNVEATPNLTSHNRPFVRHSCGNFEVERVKCFSVNVGCAGCSLVNSVAGARGGGGDSHMKWTGMLVVSLRGVNFGFWSRLGCSGQNVIIFSRQGLV